MALQLYQGKKLQEFLAAFVSALVIAAGPVSGADFDIADRVVVKKSERKLLLMKDGRILKSSDIALGLVPDGHKEEEGDFRTPEGNYRLIDRNVDSDYFLSIQISYPNAADDGRARSRGVSPGGQIMIHGQPNSPAYSPEYYRRTDWTNGCIAVSNSDMVDIWLMTAVDTPIQILP
jgi:murein L,D-transpeptidase YafK